MKKIYILGFLLIAFMFYWSQVRPVIIRKQCFNKINEQASKQSSGFTNSLTNYLYRTCLTEHGLKPENLLNE